MVAYLNDIFIYLKIFEEYIKYIKIIFRKLVLQKFMIKEEKCDFYKYEIDFLDFVVEREGIKINSIKIKKILDWPKPKNVIKFQEFLKFSNFNRRFISHYLIIIISLIELIKKIYYLIKLRPNRKRLIFFKKFLL